MSSKKNENIKTSENTKSVNSRNKQAKTYFKKYLLLLIAVGIIGIIIAAVKYFGKDKMKRNSSISIEFTYDGAAQNLTPSGEQFSISGITDEKIIAEALAAEGLSDKYTVDSIISSMTVNGQYPSDVINQIKDYDSLYDFSESRMVTLNDYYPTIYAIKLYDDFDPNISDSAMNKLLSSIVECYKKYFINKYIYAFDDASFDALMVLDNYDYSQRVKVLNYRMSLIEKYAGEMYALNTNFKSKGMSFNDLLLKCKTLRTDSLGNIEATVMTDVLTTSKERLKNQYEYEIKLLENEKTYKTAGLEDLNALINSYEMDADLYIGGNESMVKVESHSQKTYEELVDRKREISERLVKIDSEIEKYQLYLSDLSKTSYAGSLQSKANTIAEKLKTVSNKLGEIEETFKEMMTAYNRTIIDEDSVIIDSARNYSAKLLSSGFILTAIKCAGPLCILVLIGCALHAAWIERKKFLAENVA